ncbi:MAG: hypothetical protein NXI14_09810, partial [bacterium]|nr:hypothetical protein [bacterium]
VSQHTNTPITHFLTPAPPKRPATPLWYASGVSAVQIRRLPPESPLNTLSPVVEGASAEP